MYIPGVSDFIKHAIYAVFLAVFKWNFVPFEKHILETSRTCQFLDCFLLH